VVLRPGAEDVLSTSDFTATYTINSKGLRDREISPKRTGEEFRILAFGESTLFGEGVNYGFRLSEVVEQALEGVEVINMGVPGFGLDQSLLQLGISGFESNPDAGIIFIFSSDYLYRCMDIAIPGSLTAKPRFVLNNDKNGVILQNIEYTKNEIENDYFYKARPLQSGPDKDILQKNELINSPSSLLTLLNYCSKKEKIYNKMLSEETEYFRGTKEIVFWQQKNRKKYNQDDFEKLIFLLVKEYQKIFADRGIDLIIVNMSQERLDLIERATKDLDIFYLDLSKFLAKAALSEELQFALNGHYNEIYHRIVGEYVSNYLKDKYNLKAAPGFNFRYFGEF